MVLQASDVLRKKASEGAIIGPGRGLDTEKISAQKTELWVGWRLDRQRSQIPKRVRSTISSRTSIPRYKMNWAFGIKGS